jgi:hypothetical protein
MHTVKTTIVTSATGEITGYGFCVEAEHTGEPAEIAACITASLDMLRATIGVSFPQPAATDKVITTEEPAAPAQEPPSSPEEAERRFYARYGFTIGGDTWADVKRYLRQPRRPHPATIEQWYATARAVRTVSSAQA